MPSIMSLKLREESSDLAESVETLLDGPPSSDHKDNNKPPKDKEKQNLKGPGKDNGNNRGPRPQSNPKGKSNKEPAPPPHPPEPPPSPPQAKETKIPGKASTTAFTTTSESSRTDSDRSTATSLPQSSSTLSSSRDIATHTSTRPIQSSSIVASRNLESVTGIQTSSPIGAAAAVVSSSPANSVLANGDSHHSRAVLIDAVVGGIFGALAIIAMIVFVIKRRARRRRLEHFNVSMVDTSRAFRDGLTSQPISRRGSKKLVRKGSASSGRSMSSSHSGASVSSSPLKPLPLTHAPHYGMRTLTEGDTRDLPRALGPFTYSEPESQTFTLGFADMQNSTNHDTSYHMDAGASESRRNSRFTSFQSIRLPSLASGTSMFRS